MIGTRSIRARVLGAMFVVLFVNLLTVGIIVDALFMNRQSQALDDSLDRSASYVLDKARTATDAEALMADVEPTIRFGGSDDVFVEITLADGRTLGHPPDQDARTVVEILDTTQPALQDATVEVWTTTAELNGTRRSLDTTLMIVGIIGLAGASLLTIAITDVALKPLQTMVERANRIADGERGLRMASPVTTTEVGATAAAIDEMLDALEGAEIRARSAEEQARASAEQTKSFLSDAAHELKTPLAGIKAAAESIIQLPEDAVEEREQLSYLLAREAHRGGELVNSLLEAARVDAGPELRPETLDLADLASAEGRRMSLTMPRLRFLVRGPDLLVKGDRQGITSVLRNLVDNAARAAGPEGTVVVDLSSRVDPIAEQEMAVVRVVDSGPGIALDDRERVFDRLVRLAATASTTKGSGLGLPIARGYARAHGGDVVCLDATGFELPRDEDGDIPPTGAVFEFFLPRAMPATVNEVSPVEASVGATEHPETSARYAETGV